MEAVTEFALATGAQDRLTRIGLVPKNLVDRVHFLPPVAQLPSQTDTYHLVSQVREIHPDRNAMTEDNTIYKYLGDHQLLVRDKSHPDRPELLAPVVMAVHCKATGSDDIQIVPFAFFPDPARPGQVLLKATNIERLTTFDHGEVAWEYDSMAVTNVRGITASFDHVYNLATLSAMEDDEDFRICFNEPLMYLLWNANKHNAIVEYARGMVWTRSTTNPQYWALRANDDNRPLRQAVVG